MNEIDLVSRVRPEISEPDPDTMNTHRQALLDQAARERNAHYKRRTRLRRPKLAFGGAATALAACAAVIALVVGGVWPVGSGTGRPQATGPGSDNPGAMQRRVSLKVAQMLDRASHAADRQPSLTAQPQQWAYTEYVLNEPRWSRRHQMWRQVDGSDIYVRTHSGGKTVEHRRTIPAGRQPGPEFPPLTDPSYGDLQSLPTEPAKLQAVIYDQAREAVEASKQQVESGAATSVDQRVFTLVSRALPRCVPPNLEAALYQVLKTVPGIVVQPDVTDAIGRKGIGLTYEGPISMILIFDTDTYEFIGARIPTEKRATALIDTGIVDEAGVTP